MPKNNSFENSDFGFNSVIDVDISLLCVGLRHVSKTFFTGTRVKGSSTIRSIVGQKELLSSEISLKRVG
jgi:hypothetical protein